MEKPPVDLHTTINLFIQRTVRVGVEFFTRYNHLPFTKGVHCIFLVYPNLEMKDKY